MFKKFMSKKRNKKRGFTLIELIIVIAIIAILAAIAVPAFGQIRQKSNVSADVANARTIYSTVASLVADETIGLPTQVTTYYLDKVGTGSLNLVSNSTTEYLPSLSEPKAYQNSQFVVTIDQHGNIEVGIQTSAANTNGTATMTHEIYPNASTGSYYGSN